MADTFEYKGKIYEVGKFYKFNGQWKRANSNPKARFSAVGDGTHGTFDYRQAPAYVQKEINTRAYKSPTRQLWEDYGKKSIESNIVLSIFGFNSLGFVGHLIAPLFMPKLNEYLIHNSTGTGKAGEAIVDNFTTLLNAPIYYKGQMDHYYDDAIVHHADCRDSECTMFTLPHLGGRDLVSLFARGKSEDVLPIRSINGFPTYKGRFLTSSDTIKVPESLRSTLVDGTSSYANLEHLTNLFEGPVDDVRNFNWSVNGNRLTYVDKWDTNNKLVDEFNYPFYLRLTLTMEFVPDDQFTDGQLSLWQEFVKHLK